MQRSKRLDGTMDRNWEAERRGAKRAEARLNNGLQEIQDAQMYYVNSMTREQKKLQMDLVKMKQATAKSKNPTRRGVPQSKPALHPAASGEQLAKRATQAESTRKQTKGPVMASGSSVTLQTRINDFMDGVGKKGKTEPGTSVTDLRNAMARRLSIAGNPTSTDAKGTKGQAPTDGAPSASTDLSPGPSMKASPQETSLRPTYINLQASKARRGSLMKDRIIFDEDTYAPDGGLRTLHTMPDLMDSLEEAKKARYIRHKGKIESERELSVQEIFHREEDEKDFFNDTVS